MPIPIAQLEEAQRSISDRILSFLQKQPDQAFTATEIFAALNNLDAQVISLVIAFANRPSETLQRWTTELQSLVNQGLVQSADIGGITYFGMARR